MSSMGCILECPVTEARQNLIGRQVPVALQRCLSGAAVHDLDLCVMVNGAHKKMPVWAEFVSPQVRPVLDAGGDRRGQVETQF